MAFISVVIPAYNAERTIARCLESVFANLPRDAFEVIVADNGSTDSTRQIVSTFPARIIDVPEDLFVSSVRNAGAVVAQGPYLAFVDSDCLLTPGWHRSVLVALEDPAVGIAGSPHQLPDNPSWCERAWHEAYARDVRDGCQQATYVPAGNMVMRRSVFEEVGGFDCTLETGEDPDLCYRVAMRGYKVLMDPSIICIHLGNPKTLMDVFRRESWHGRGVRLRYPDGTLSPVVLATSAFAVLLAVAIGTPILATATGRPLLAAGIFAPLAVPLASALVRGRGLRVRTRAALAVIFFFYYLGRTRALGIAIRRMLAQDSK